MKCIDDAQTLLNFIGRNRILEFLAGLNAEFDPMRVQNLGKERLPPLNEVFSIVPAKERRRLVMLQPWLAEGTALLSANR